MATSLHTCASIGGAFVSVAVLWSCEPFSAGASTSSRALPDAMAPVDAAPAPEGGAPGTPRFCDGVERDASIFFCDDFDDRDAGISRWRQADTEDLASSYTVDRTDFASAPAAARLAVVTARGPGDDARLYFEIPEVVKGVTVEGKALVAVRGKKEIAPFVGIYFPGNGGVLGRLDGNAIEIVQGTAGTAPGPNIAGSVRVPDKEWTNFMLSVDISAGQIRFRVGGGAVGMSALDPSKSFSRLTISIGPSETGVGPEVTDFVILYDDIVIRATR